VVGNDKVWVCSNREKEEIEEEPALSWGNAHHQPGCGPAVTVVLKIREVIHNTQYKEQRPATLNWSRKSSQTVSQGQNEEGRSANISK